MVGPDEGTLFADRYRLDRRLGGTGIGEVWRALDERLERQVAIKIIQPRFARDEKRLERFERGAKSVAKLSHPHVVQLLDFGVAGRPFMVMELLDGAVLREPLETGHTFPRPVAVSIVVQTAKALSAAHEAGIVHRKLEPGNIFLVGGLDDPFVKVFDFGTAKWLTGFKGAQDLTTMGAILGAPHYVAPEQLSGEERSDHRADIWSLAAIAYHLVVGQAPFAGTEIGEVMRRILTEAPPKPSSLRGSLTEDTDIFFEQALAKDRDQRFQSARGFASALCDVTGIEIGPSRVSVPEAEPATGAVAVGRIVDVAGSSAPIEDAEDEGMALAAEVSSNEAPAEPERGGEGDVEPTPLSVPPSIPVERVGGRLAVALGAVVALAIGGIAAWFVYGQNTGETGAPETAASATGPTDAGHPASGPGETGASSTVPVATATASTAPSATATTSASASVSASASASASVKTPPRPYVPPPSWRNYPEDIYEP